MHCYLLKLFINGLGFLVSLEPHHVLGVESPGLLFQRLRCQILRLCTLPHQHQHHYLIIVAHFVSSHDNRVVSQCAACALRLNAPKSTAEANLVAHCRV